MIKEAFDLSRHDQELTLTPQDQEEITNIYIKYSERISKQILFLLGNVRHMEEVRQEVFLVLCRQWETVRTFPEPVLNCWLKKTARNLSMNFLKKNKRDQAQLILDDEEQAIDPSFTIDFENELFAKEHPVQEEAALDWVAERLNESDRTLFAMLRSGMSRLDIIRQNGKSVGATRTQTTRLKAKVKELLTEYFAEWDNQK